jgi:hypothetical protein
MRWVERIAFIKGLRNYCTVFHEESEWNRPLGRRRDTWENVDYIILIKDGRTENGNEDPSSCKVGNFFTTERLFTRKTVLHAVI